MSPADLLATLADQGAALALDADGRVRYHGLTEVLTPDLKQVLRAHLDLLPEVLRRAEVFRGQVRPNRPLPFFRLPGAVGLPPGRCPSCGGNLEARAYRCNPCGEAARLVASQTRPCLATSKTQTHPNPPKELGGSLE